MSASCLYSFLFDISRTFNSLLGCNNGDDTGDSDSGDEGGDPGEPKDPSLKFDSIDSGVGCSGTLVGHSEIHWCGKFVVESEDVSFMRL